MKRGNIRTPDRTLDRSGRPGIEDSRPEVNGIAIEMCAVYCASILEVHMSSRGAQPPGHIPDAKKKRLPSHPTVLRSRCLGSQVVVPDHFS